jgi:hypothetical protein
MPAMPVELSASPSPANPEKKKRLARRVRAQAHPQAAGILRAEGAGQSGGAAPARPAPPAGRPISS